MLENKKSFHPQLLFLILLAGFLLRLTAIQFRIFQSPRDTDITSRICRQPIFSKVSSQ